jgi:ABC-type uncharacterized transport system permease subunit
MSSTTTYTPTLIEKLLGRNYKWWYITLFHFKSTTAHRFEIISNIFANILSFLTAFFTWYIAFQSGANINFNQIATYFIIGIMITAFTSMILEYEISQEIINGKINNKLLIPTNIFNFFYFKALGNVLFYAPATILAFTSVSFLFLPYLQAPATILAFILSLVSIIFIGRTIIFFYCILIGSSAFKFINNSGFIRTFGHIFIFTSGSTFPLDIIDQVQ